MQAQAHETEVSRPWWALVVAVLALLGAGYLALDTASTEQAAAQTPMVEVAPGGALAFDDIPERSSTTATPPSFRHEPEPDVSMTTNRDTTTRHASDLGLRLIYGAFALLGVLLAATLVYAFTQGGEPSRYDASLPNPMGGPAATAPGEATGTVSLTGLEVDGAEVALGEVVEVPASGSVELAFPLQMHAGMGGFHHLAVPLTSPDGEEMTALQVTGDFFAGANL